MHVLVIAGTSSGAGKTTLACALLQRLPGWGAVKVSEPHGRHGGPDLRREDPSTVRRGSDTARFLAAGAVRAWWLRARREEVAAAVPRVWAEADGLPGLVVEGNRAAGAFGGRLVLVAHAARPEVKLSARPLLALADTRVLNAPRRLDGLPLAEWTARLPGAPVADLDDPLDPARESLLYGLISTLI